MRELKTGGDNIRRQVFDWYVKSSRICPISSPNIWNCPVVIKIRNIQNQSKMKKIILIIMSLLTFSCSSKAQEQTMNASRQSEKKILVAYFSCTGTTEKVANAIAKTVNGKLYRITPAEKLWCDISRLSDMVECMSTPNQYLPWEVRLFRKSHHPVRYFR